MTAGKPRPTPITFVPIVLAAFAMSSCGGGGDSSGSGGSTGTAPTPAPSPSTPTPPSPPSPPSPPAPTIDYSVNPCDFSRTQSYDMTGALLTGTGPINGPFTAASVTLLDSSAAVTADYAPTGQVLTLKAGGTTVESLGAANLIEATSSNRIYRTDSRIFSYRCNYFEGVTQRYNVSLAQAVNLNKGQTAGSDVSARLLSGGLRTMGSTAIASRTYQSYGTGAAVYAGNAEAYRDNDAVNNPFTTTFDAATGRLTGAVTLEIDRNQTPITLNFVANRGAGTSLLSGTVTSGSATGTLTGGFFGPAGEEIGVVLTLTRGPDRFAVYLFGR